MPANGRMSLDTTHHYNADNDNEDKLNHNKPPDNQTSRSNTEKRRLNTLSTLHRLLTDHSHSRTKLPAPDRRSPNAAGPHYSHNTSRQSHHPYGRGGSGQRSPPGHYPGLHSDSDPDSEDSADDSLDELLSEHLHTLASNTDSEHNSNFEDGAEAADESIGGPDASGFGSDGSVDHAASSDGSADADSPFDHHLSTSDDGLGFLVDHHSLPEDELNSAAIQLSLLMEADHSSSLMNGNRNDDLMTGSFLSELSSSLDALMSPSASLSSGVLTSSPSLVSRTQDLSSQMLATRSIELSSSSVTVSGSPGRSVISAAISPSFSAATSYFGMPSLESSLISPTVSSPTIDSAATSSSIFTSQSSEIWSSQIPSSQIVSSQLPISSGLPTETLRSDSISLSSSQSLNVESSSLGTSLTSSSLINPSSLATTFSLHSSSSLNHEPQTEHSHTANKEKHNEIAQPNAKADIRHESNTIPNHQTPAPQKHTLSFVLLADHEQKQPKAGSSGKQSNELEYSVQGESAGSKARADQEPNNSLTSRQVGDPFSSLAIGGLLASAVARPAPESSWSESSWLASQQDALKSSSELFSSESAESTKFLPSTVRRSDADESMITRIVDNSKSRRQPSSSKRKQQKVIIRPILPIDDPYGSSIDKSTPSLADSKSISELNRLNELSARKIGEPSGHDILVDPINPSSSSATPSKRIHTKTVGMTHTYDDLNEFVPLLSDENQVDSAQHPKHHTTTTTASSAHKSRSKFGSSQPRVSGDSFLARINHKQVTSSSQNYEIKSRTTLFGFAHFTTVISGTEIVFSPTSTSGYHQFSSTNAFQSTAAYPMNSLISHQPPVPSVPGKVLKQQNHLPVLPQGIIKPSKTRNFLIKTKSRVIYRNQQNNPNFSHLPIPTRHSQMPFKNPLAINPSIVNAVPQGNPFQYGQSRGQQAANLPVATPPLILNNALNKASSQPVAAFNYVTKPQPPALTKPTFSINVLPNKIKMLPVGVVSTIPGPRSHGFNQVTEYTTLVIGTYIHGTYAHLLQTTSHVRQIVPTAALQTPQITITSGFILPSHIFRNQFDQIKPSKSSEQSSQPTSLNSLALNKPVNAVASDQSTKVLMFTPAITVFSTRTHLATQFKNGQATVSTRKEVVSSVLSPTVAASELSSQSITSSGEQLQSSAIPSASSQIQPSLASPVDSSKIESSSSKTLPLSSSQVMINHPSASQPPLELTIYTTLVKDGKTTLSSSIATLTSTIEKLSTDDEVGESDEDDRPHPTVTTTFYTTFTYFTTLYSNGTKMITSNYETITNIASNEPPMSSSAEPSSALSPHSIRLVNANSAIQPTKSVTLIMNKNSQLVESSFPSSSPATPSSSLIGRSIDGNAVDSTVVHDELRPSVDVEPKLPITHYTTFTYLTTLFRDNKPSTQTRTEVVTNVVTDVIKPTVSLNAAIPPSAAPLTTNKNDLLLTSGSQLESRLQLPGSFGGRLEPVRTPALAQLPKPSAPIDLDRLTPEQKKQLLLLRPDLFRKKLQTVYTTYTSSKTHLINGSPSVETLYATVTNVIADGQTPYTVGNSVDQAQFQLPITSSSTHHVILRSRSDDPSVTHYTTITHYTTFAQGGNLLTATRKETRSDIRPNPLMMTIAPTGQRRPIVIRRTRSRALNQPQIQATRIHPDQAKLAPIVVVTKQQQQYVNRVQQQLQLQQQQQLRQLNALKQQQLALQKQQELTIQNHYSQVIRQQQLQRSALDNKNSNPVTEASLQARQVPNDGRVGESIEVVNHNSKLKELEIREKKENVTQVPVSESTTQQTSVQPSTSTTTEKPSTTEKPLTTEKPSTTVSNLDLSASKKEASEATTTSPTTTTSQASSTLNNTVEVRTEKTTSSPEPISSSTPATETSKSTDANRTEPVNSNSVSTTGAPTLRRRKLMFVELEEIESALPTAGAAHSSPEQNTLTDPITTDQFAHHAHSLTKPSTSQALPHTPEPVSLAEPEHTHASSLSLSSGAVYSPNVHSSSSNATADANSRRLENELNTAHSAGMYALLAGTVSAPADALSERPAPSRITQPPPPASASPLITNNHEPIAKLAKQITRSQVSHDNLPYLELPASSIDSQNCSLHSSANAIASTQTSDHQAPGSRSAEMSALSALTYQTAATERSSKQPQALPTVTHRPSSELTGLVSAIKSTLIIEELTIVYTTEYIGTYIHGVYAHLARTKSEVISSTPSLFTGITLTQPPVAEQIRPTESFSLPESSSLSMSTLTAEDSSRSTDSLESSPAGGRSASSAELVASSLVASSLDASQSAPVYMAEQSSSEETPSLSIQATATSSTSESSEVKGGF